MVKFDEKSCGIILFNTLTDQTRQYLLLQYPQGHWSFIKGHVEPNETETQTALRELQEETTISDAKLLPNFRHQISYSYNHHHTGKLSHKEVIYFLAETKTTQVTLSHEHQNYSWVPENQVLEALTYKNAQNLFQQVLQHFHSEKS